MDLQELPSGPHGAALPGIWQPTPGLGGGLPQALEVVAPEKKKKRLTINHPLSELICILMKVSETGSGELGGQVQRRGEKEIGKGKWGCGKNQQKTTFDLAHTFKAKQSKGFFCM